MCAQAADLPPDDDTQAPPDWPVQPGGRPTGLSLAGGMGMMMRLLLGVLVSGLAGLTGGLIYGARMAGRSVATGTLPAPIPPAREVQTWGDWLGSLFVYGAMGLVAGAALGVAVMLAWTLAGGGLRTTAASGRPGP